ncbi:hypothetical protein NKR23_g12254, partial [Pleurostoma richardsiae]
MNPPGLNVIPYEPGSGRAPAPRQEHWEGVVNLISRGLALDRQNLAAPFLHSLPALRNEEPIETAARLARNILADDSDSRGFKELLLVTFCVVLERCAFNNPEQTGAVLRIIAGNVQERQLGVLKRGARLANDIVFEWAAQSEHPDSMYRLALAT